MQALAKVMQWLWWSWVVICTIAVAYLLRGSLGTIVGWILLLHAIALFLTVMHELGHAVAAWVTGWRVHEIAIGHLRVHPRTRTVHWRTSSGVHHADIAGWVYATPRPHNLTRRGKLAISFGGGLADLTVAVVCLCLALGPIESPLHPSLLLLIAGLAALDAALNLNPWMKWRGLESDGRQIHKEVLRRLRGEPPDRRQQLSDRIAGNLYDRGPVDPLDIAELKAICATDPMDLEAERLSQLVALQTGDLLWLRELIQQQEARGVTATGSQLSSLALACAVLERDAVAGRAYLERVRPEERVGDAYFLRGLAAVEYVEGRQVQALSALSELRRLHGRNFGDRDDRLLFAAIEKGLPLPQLNCSAPLARGRQD